MITTLSALAALVLSVLLPTFPEGLTPAIVAFLGLIALAGVGGALRARAARAELSLLAPWVLALALGLINGALRGHESVQFAEDALPYLLFALGLCAGRGAARPRWLLVAVVAVAIFDGVASIARMPSFDLPNVRSTYNYFKVIVGHLLVAVFVAAFLFEEARRRRRAPSPWTLWLVEAILVVSVIVTVSRGMVLSLALGVLVTFVLRRPARGVSLALAMGLVALLFAPALWDFGEAYLRFGTLSTVHGRMREIVHCLQVFARNPLFGAGLGAEFIVDAHVVSYVHNMVAYHLWKFGLVGSTLLAGPLLLMARQAMRGPVELRAPAIGGAACVLAYLVTCAAYKSYILVPMVGVTVGAIFELLVRARRDDARRLDSRARDEG